MSYYGPYDLVVGVVAAALEAACKTAIGLDDDSRIDLVETYDFSGDPTKVGTTANKIAVKPDPEIGQNRGDYPTSSAIGLGPRTWAYHVQVEIDAFPIKTTRDRDEVRAIAAKIDQRVRQALALLARTGISDTTADAHWHIIMPDEKFIQGSGPVVKDTGRNAAIRSKQSLVVGFILQYTP